MEELTDDSIMMIGREWKGRHLHQIPDKYFDWFWGANKTWYIINKVKSPQPKSFKFKLMVYIEENFDM